MKNLRFTSLKFILFVSAVLLLGTVNVSAEEQTTSKTDIPKEEVPKGEDKSPWLILPTLSASPKLETAVGAMAGYITKFDEKSHTSLFAVTANYTTSESVTAGLMAKTSFDEDHHRLNAGLVLGKINNEYKDYLGTGMTVNTQDDLRASFLRYVYRFTGNYFGGIQGSFTNYQLLGKTISDDKVLDELGLVGHKSGGLGLALMHDSRDNDFKPSKGWYMNVNNIAYREDLGGNSDFEIYRADLRIFRDHGKANVFAIRQRNQWASEDTPSGAYSPIYLRGYTPGEYLAQYMSAIEVEERYAWSDKWTSTFFGGVAWLYGDGADRYSYDYFPSIGAGLQYIIKPKAGIVLNLEAATGKGSNNNGIYLNMGYGF